MEIAVIEEWIINNEPLCMGIMLNICIVIGACMIFGSIK